MPFNLLTYALIAASLFAVGFGSGWQVNGWRYQAKEVTVLKEFNKQKQILEKFGTDMVIKLQKEEKKKKIVYRTIKEKVYVETSGKLCLNSNAVRLWNEALFGETELPKPPAGASEEASGAGATDRDILKNAIENMEQYKDCRDQLNALIDWHERK